MVSGYGGYILLSEIARTKLQAIEPTTDRIATTPIDAVLLLGSTPENIPTTPLDQSLPQLEETGVAECSDVAGSPSTDPAGNKPPLLPTRQTTVITRYLFLPQFQARTLRLLAPMSLSQAKP